MQAPFHWLRTETFIDQTENSKLVSEIFSDLVGTFEFEKDISESEYGSQLIILKTYYSHRIEQENIFKKMGIEIAKEIYSDLENKIDDDCVFYLRLDKQKAVCGKYEIAHHGDVIQITGKIASNPAKHDVALQNMKNFLTALFPDLSPESP